MKWVHAAAGQIRVEEQGIAGLFDPICLETEASVELRVMRTSWMPGLGTRLSIHATIARPIETPCQRGRGMMQRQCASTGRANQPNLLQ